VGTPTVDEHAHSKKKRQQNILTTQNGNPAPQSPSPATHGVQQEEAIHQGPTGSNPKPQQIP
jgi:hypothetical protein